MYSVYRHPRYACNGIICIPNLFRHQRGLWDTCFDLEIHPCIGTACLALQGEPLVIAQSCSLPWESAICPVGFTMVQRELETWSGELNVFVRIIWLCPENRLASCRKQWPRWRRPGDVTGRRSDVSRLCKGLGSGGGAGCSGRGMMLLGMSGKLLFNPSGSLPNAAFWTIWHQELSLSRHCWQFLSPQHTVTNCPHRPCLTDLRSWFPQWKLCVFRPISAQSTHSHFVPVSLKWNF